MDEIERYIFDTQGCLVIPGVLTSSEVAGLRAGIPRTPDGTIITAENPCTFGGLLNYAEPLLHSLIAHPAVMPRLRTLLLGQPGDPCAERILLSDEYGLCFTAGQKGPWFHHGGTPYRPWLSYHSVDGRIFCGLVGVRSALTDVADGDGGFWYIPGSHKAAFPLPRAIETYEQVPSCAVQPALRAGSVIIFTESLTHGTRNWAAATQRLALFYKYAPGHHLPSPRVPVTAELSEEQRGYLALAVPPPPTG